MTEFESLLKARRSANKFIPGMEILDTELEEIFQLVKFAPSAFNLQHTHYVVVKEQPLKQKMYEAAHKQYKVQTASAVIIVLGKKNAYQDVGRLHEGLLALGVMNQQEYDLTVRSVLDFYEGRGEAFQQEEAIRNASLSAMLFMLIAKEKGWDSCPMIGFDPEALREALHIPEDYIPALMITLGKEDTSNQRPRGYRKPTGEFVSYGTFK